MPGAVLNRLVTKSPFKARVSLYKLLSVKIINAERNLRGNIARW